MPRRLSLVFGVAILSVVALVPAVAATSPRSGDLHITKECSQYTFAAGGFCTITSSNINAIKVGSRVVYASAPGPTSLDTDIKIVRQGNSIAYGHVYLNLGTGFGTVTLSGGTGEFRGFTAAAVDVTPTGFPNWAWDGTYSFSPPK